MAAICKSVTTVETLTGSSKPTGKPPKFKPIASGADPIFAAIEKHRAAFDAFEEAIGKYSEGPKVEAASRADGRAFRALGKTVPTTAAGLLALLEHTEAYAATGDTRAPDEFMPAIAKACRRLIPAASTAVPDAALLALKPEYAALLAHKVEADAVLDRAESKKVAGKEPSDFWDVAEAQEEALRCVLAFREHIATHPARTIEGLFFKSTLVEYFDGEFDFASVQVLNSIITDLKAMAGEDRQFVPAPVEAIQRVA
jgi:hypothetical protein